MLAVLALATIIALPLAGFPHVQLQRGTAPRPVFEVISIKPSRAGDLEKSQLIKPGRWEAKGATVRDLIAHAYAYGQPAPSLRDNQILGAPKWIDSKKYDIEAMVDRALVESEEKKLPFMEWRAQIQLMIQSMLADRFELKLTEESVQRPGYALVVAKGGPKMPQTEAPPPEPSIDAPVSPWAKPGRMGLAAPGNFNLHAFTLADFADRLTNLPELGGRPVFDRTGLSGTYDFVLSWAPSSMGPIGTHQYDGAPPTEPNGPSLFTALREQLGLKMVPAIGPVYTVVIQHIEEPTAN